MALRVVIVTPWGERLGGAEEMLWTALSNCDRSRLDPICVFLSPGEFEGDVAGLGITTEVIPSGRLRELPTTLRTVRRLAGLLRSRRPDLLLNWSAKAHLYGSAAATLARMREPVVWWQHQIPDGQGLDRYATLAPAVAVGCSSSAGSDAQATLFPARRTFVVNPGIDIGGFPSEDPTDLRERLGIPSGRLVVGIVGRLQPWKGQDRFLVALAELRNRGMDVHGLIVGGDAFELSPEYATGLKDLARRSGLSEFVTMTGQVPDSDRYFGVMDDAVNASDEEPFGIVLLEAMAAGVPVVAVGAGGPLDIIDPGVTGLLAASGASSDLADAINPLLQDADLRNRLGSAGRRRCLQHFTGEGMAHELVTRLAEVEAQSQEKPEEGKPRDVSLT